MNKSLGLKILPKLKTPTTLRSNKIQCAVLCQQPTDINCENFRDSCSTDDFIDATYFPIKTTPALTAEYFIQR